MKKLFEHFKSRWTNKYLRELRNTIIIKKNKKYVLHTNVGDIVGVSVGVFIIHEDVLKHCDWGIGKIVELIKKKRR